MSENSLQKQPQVAVITRTKNRPLLLERAIKSVHAQTMPDFIHVIINDGGAPKEVERLVEKYKFLIQPRIKVIHNKQSAGIEAASNKGIQATNSKYIAIHDDDDSWHCDFLKRTIEHLEQTGAMGVVVTTDCVFEKIVENNVVEIRKERLFPELEAVSLYKQCLDNYVTPITFLYRREVFETIGYYDEAQPVNGDWVFALRFLMHYDIEYLKSEPALAYYHYRPEANDAYGNTVFAGRKQHIHNMNRLGNQFLRKDFSQGKFGPGFIMNSLRYQSEVECGLNNQIEKLTNLIENIIQSREQLTQQMEHLETRLNNLLIERTSLGHRILKFLSWFKNRFRFAASVIIPRKSKKF